MHKCFSKESSFPEAFSQQPSSHFHKSVFPIRMRNSHTFPLKSIFRRRVSIIRRFFGQPCSIRVFANRISANTIVIYAARATWLCVLYRQLTGNTSRKWLRLSIERETASVSSGTWTYLDRDNWLVTHENERRPSSPWLPSERVSIKHLALSLSSQRLLSSLHCVCGCRLSRAAEKYKIVLFLYCLFFFIYL